MERRQAAFLVALSVAAVTALLVPAARPDIGMLVVLIGAGVTATVLTGYGGSYLLLCLGEVFAVVLGTASLVLGVLFQPAIVVMLCNDDRTSLIVGASTTLIAAAGVLVFRQPLFLLLAFLVASACLAAGMMGADAWIRRRLSSGDVA